MTASLHTLFPVPQKATGVRFDELWSIWPNKAKKPLARAKYEAIIAGKFKTKTLDKDSGTYVDIELDATEDRVIAGCKAYLASQIDRNTYKLRDGGRYVPALSVFLNGGRYEDNL